MSLDPPDFGEIRVLAEKKKEAFEAFRSLLLFYNQRFNLTSVTEERDVFYKHFLDSLAGERFLKQNSLVAEVGSGAGFPSIPLKIVREDLRFVLIESTGKKCEFLKTAVRELGLSDVEIVCARAEDAGRMPEYRERADACVARAVAKLNTLAEYCLPLVKRGGIFLAYKGSADELGEAKNAFSLLGGDPGEETRYELPEGYGARRLVLVRKKSSTPAAYPRGQGKERRSPL